MAKPDYVATELGEIDGFDHPEGQTRETALALLTIPGGENYAALWNGHEFEVAKIFVADRLPHPWTIIKERTPNDEYEATETSMLLHFPIDPRTNVKDWRGATSAYANKANDGWLPAHCDVDHMLDREVEIKSAVIAAFAPGMQKLQQACLLQLSLLAKNSSDSSAGSRELAARLKLDKLTEFQNKVLAHCETEARKRYLGWYHQNPDESHIHNIVHDAVTTLYHKNSDDFSLVQNEIMRSAFTVHTYETRWDQEARLKKEAEAAKAAADAAEQEEQGNGD